MRGHLFKRSPKHSVLMTYITSHVAQAIKHHKAKHQRVPKAARSATNDATYKEESHLPIPRTICDAKHQLYRTSNYLHCVLESFLELYQEQPVEHFALEEQREALALVKTICDNLISEQHFFYLQHVAAMNKLTRLLKRIKSLNPVLEDGKCWYQHVKKPVHEFSHASHHYIELRNKRFSE